MFYDVVPAVSEVEASNRIESLRGYYAEVVNIQSVSDFGALAKSLQRSTVAGSEAVLKDLEHGMCNI